MNETSILILTQVITEKDNSSNDHRIFHCDDDNNAVSQAGHQVKLRAKTP